MHELYFFYNRYYHDLLIDLEYSLLHFYSVSAEYKLATGDDLRMNSHGRRR